MPAEGKETKLGHSEKTETGLGGGASSTPAGKRGFLVEPKPQEETSPRRGMRDYTQHHTNVPSVGPRRPLEGLHPFGGLSTILFIDPACPPYSCCQIKLFSSPRCILAVPEMKGDGISTPGGQIPRQQLEFAPPEAPVELCRSDENSCCFPTFTMQKEQALPGESPLRGAFVSLNLELRMLMTFWQFYFGEQSGKARLRATDT